MAHPPHRRRRRGRAVASADVLGEVGEEAEDLLVEVAVRRPEGGDTGGGGLGPRLAVAVVAALEAGKDRGSNREKASILHGLECDTVD